MSHATELQAVRKLIGALGGACYKTGQRAMRTETGHWYIAQSPGIPDLYVHWVAPGYAPERAFWVEVKVGPDKLRPAQVEFKRREEAAGGVVLVGGVTEVIGYLNARGAGIKA